MNAIIKVGLFRSGTVLDKNAKASIFCSVIAGSYPRSRMVMAGSVAEMHNLEPDKTYLVSITQTPGKAEYTTHDNLKGESLNWAITVVTEFKNPVELLQSAELIGESNVINDVKIAELEAA